MERAYTRKIWKMPLPFWNFSSASPYSIFYRFWENQENGFAPQHKIVRCSTVLLGQGRFPILRKGTPIFHFLRKICIFVRFFGKQENCCAPIGQRYFPFLAVQNPAPERGANCMPYPGKSQPIPHETPFLKHEFRDRRKWETPWAAIYGFRAS